MSCPHVREVRNVLPARAEIGAACEECLKTGQRWVHLRQCLVCGHVGCCDSSIGKHASGHFRDTGHPVMRSIEPNETWAWCYVDEIALNLPV